MRDGAAMTRRAANFYRSIARRRTVRMFSDRPVPRSIIKKCVMNAGTAPSGPNFQPWHFVVVSAPEIKCRIRLEAEKAERQFYGGRAPKAWLKALEPLGTDAKKPYLEIAPYLIVVFQRSYDIDAASEHTKMAESVGIATGILLTALNHFGLATLTHTPSPMGFLRTLLGRPTNERAAMIVVVGYPEEQAGVPDIERKPLDDNASLIE